MKLLAQLPASTPQVDDILSVVTKRRLVGHGPEQYARLLSGRVKESKAFFAEAHFLSCRQMLVDLSYVIRFRRFLNYFAFATQLLRLCVK